MIFGGNGLDPEMNMMDNEGQMRMRTINFTEIWSNSRYLSSGGSNQRTHLTRVCPDG